MKLTQLAAEPQLVKLTITDEKIVAKYGEPIEFWVYDRQDMNTFMRLAKIDDGNISIIADVIKDMILDEDGKPIINEKRILPSDITIKAIELVVQTLGNGVSQTSAE